MCKNVGRSVGRSVSWSVDITINFASIQPPIKVKTLHITGGQLRVQGDPLRRPGEPLSGSENPLGLRSQGDPLSRKMLRGYPLGPREPPQAPMGHLTNAQRPFKWSWAAHETTFRPGVLHCLLCLIYPPFCTYLHLFYTYFPPFWSNRRRCKFGGMEVCYGARGLALRLEPICRANDSCQSSHYLYYS